MFLVFLEVLIHSATIGRRDDPCSVGHIMRVLDLADSSQVRYCCHCVQSHFGLVGQTSRSEIPKIVHLPRASRSIHRSGDPSFFVHGRIWGICAKGPEFTSSTILPASSKAITQCDHNGADKVGDGELFQLTCVSHLCQIIQKT